MSLERYSPFDLAKIEAKNYPAPPADLAGLVHELFTLSRFVDPRYPPGIFFDNVGLHETRLVTIAGLNNLPGINRDKLIRMLWVHDIPELVIGEHISPAKEANKKLAADLVAAELKAADKLLQPSDIRLLKEFNSSSALLKSETRDLQAVSAEGLVAVCQDKIDGNMFFHWSLAKWLAAGGDQGSLGRTGMAYTFEQKQTFQKSLELVTEKWSRAVTVCTGLLDYQIRFIVDAWKQVLTDRIPPLISRQLTSRI